MNTPVFLSTFGLIFLAELGDKTQLTTMTLATRYPWKTIFIGVAAAFALLNLGAVLVGKALFALVPAFWVQIASGCLFVFFGVKTLLSVQGADAPAKGEAAARGPFVTAFSMIVLAELGDKTQVATATVAAQQDAAIEVFLGSSLALWAVSLLGILLGAQITRVVPIRWVHRGAGILFLLFGALAWKQAFN